MWSFKFKFSFKKKTLVVHAPVDGNVRSLDVLKEEIFSKNYLDKGVIIEVEGPTYDLVSPIEGEVISMLPTKNVYGLKAKNGIEVQIYIGTETARLEGECFDTKVIVGQVINSGDIITTVNADMIRQAGLSPDVVIISTNVPTIKSVHFGKIEKSKLLFKTVN